MQHTRNQGAFWPHLGIVKCKMLWTWWGLTVPPEPQLYNAVTSDMMKTISENSEKRVGFFQSQRKGVFFITLHSEIWDETEKPGTMMDTQAFTGNDHPGHKCYFPLNSCICKTYHQSFQLLYILNRIWIL